MLRPVREDDAAFLFLLYAGTRAEEVAALPWSAEQREAFLRMQHLARERHYAGAYADGEDRIVEVDGRAAGRLFVHQGPDEVRIVDVALLPERRGAGIGGALLQGVLSEAAHAGRRVTVHVERSNPAQRLYERLGFVLAEDLGVYRRLAWRPPGLRG